MNSAQVDIKMLDACYNLFTSLFKKIVVKIRFVYCKIKIIEQPIIIYLQRRLLKKL